MPIKQRSITLSSVLFGIDVNPANNGESPETRAKKNTRIA